MNLGAKRVCEAVKKYQDGEVGAAWEIFWDYKCAIENRGSDIFDDKYLQQTTMHLFIYLCCFGMVRGNNALTKSDLKCFTKVIIKSKKSLKALSNIKFDELNEDNRKVVEAAYTRLGVELEKQSISSTETMITKILMACWGHTPAYDSYFVRTYRKYLKPLPGDYFKSLLKLEDKYKTAWKSRFDRLNVNYVKTKRGSPIPHARLIDMAFWQIAD